MPCHRIAPDAGGKGRRVHGAPGSSEPPSPNPVDLDILARPLNREKARSFETGLVKEDRALKLFVPAGSYLLRRLPLPLARPACSCCLPLSTTSPR